MSEKLSQLFKKINEIEPSLELEKTILAHINAENIRKLRWKLMFSKISIGISVAAFLYVFFVMGREFLGSDFANMVSLAFSDLATVAQNWNDYAFSLVETFPALTVGIILLPVFLLMVSFSYYINLVNKSYHRYI
jgi:hypothetical protein